MSHPIDAVLFDLGGVWLQDGDFDERTAWAHQHDLTADRLFDAYLSAIGPGWEGGRTEAMIHQDLVDRLHLDPDELPELTDTIVVSAEEGVAKPDPRIYRTACERIDVPPASAIFVDDKPRNVEGARAVGMQAILFTTPSEIVAHLEAALEANG